jgi:hypothetical protein
MIVDFKQVLSSVLSIFEYRSPLLIRHCEKEEEIGSRTSIAVLETRVLTDRITKRTSFEYPS